MSGSKSKYYTHGLRHKYIIFNQEWLAEFLLKEKRGNVLSFFMNLIYYGGFDRERVLDIRIRQNKFDICKTMGWGKTTWDRNIMRLVGWGLLIRVNRARYKINPNIALFSDDMNGSSLWEKPPEGMIDIESYRYNRRKPKKIKDY